MGTSGTLTIRVPGKTVRWYNHLDSYPHVWGVYIIAELRILLLLYTLPTITQLVHSLQPINHTHPPTTQQLAAFRRIAPHPPPDPLCGNGPWYDLLVTVRQSVLAVLTVGWYEQYGEECDEQYNYVIDFTGGAEERGVFTMCGGRGQDVEWEGLDALPTEIVQQMIAADERWQQQADGAEEEEEEEEQEEEEGEARKTQKLDEDNPTEAAAVAKKEAADTLYRDKQYDAARTAYGDAIHLCPLTATTAPLVATLYSHQAAARLQLNYPKSSRLGDARETIQLCHQSIAILPSVAALYWLACARELLDMMQPAVLAIKAAVILESREAAAVVVGGSSGSGSGNSGVVVSSKEVEEKLEQLEAGQGIAIVTTAEQAMWRHIRT